MEVCNYCCGSGEVANWKEVARNERTITVVLEKITCPNCSGSGIKKNEATQSKWISVEERLPEQGTCVLAAFLYYDGYRIRTARYSVSEEEPIWLIGDMSAIGSTPTHWIPLPAPPEEGA